MKEKVGIDWGIPGRDYTVQRIKNQKEGLLEDNLERIPGFCWYQDGEFWVEERIKCKAVCKSNFDKLKKVLKHNKNTPMPYSLAMTINKEMREEIVKEVYESLYQKNL